MSHFEEVRPLFSVLPDAPGELSPETITLNPQDASFHILFEQHPQPMWVFDVKTLHFLAVNDAAVSYYGYSREEFLGMRITEIRPPEDVPRLVEYIQQVRVGMRHSGLWRHISKGGRDIQSEVIAQALYFKGRKAILVVSRDVSAEKQAEDALRKYRLIFEEALLAIFQTTPDGHLLAANPAMARMLGYESPEELLSAIADVRTQLHVNLERRDEFRRLMEEHGVVRNFECELYRKDRTRLSCVANARAVREDNVIVRYEGTFEDLTERKLLEDQLRQAQKMEAVGRLAGGVAHDFNNALGVITGYADLLHMRLAADDPARRYTEEITKAGQRAAGLTRQLLAFSRKQVIQPVVLDLNSVISELEKMLRRLLGEDIKINFKRSADLGRVMADPTQIEQILMNLAINARDAMPGGGKLIIKTANAEIDETYGRQNPFVVPGSYVMLSMSDGGCGMDKQTQAHIFEPFFTTKEPGKGTGLGLSTVYGIVKQNSGFIQVYSEVGRGTTFKIYLPRVASTAPTVAAPEIPDTLPRGTETILIVEDEDGLRNLARTCLEGHGYRVLDAPDAHTALVMTQENRGAVDLVLTDVVMPGMNGRELAQRLATLQPQIRILYMSGYANDLIAQYGVIDSDTMLLEKPFTLRSLLLKVHQVLNAPLTGKSTHA